MSLIFLIEIIVCVDCLGELYVLFGVDMSKRLLALEGFIFSLEANDVDKQALLDNDCANANSFS